MKRKCIFLLIIIFLSGCSGGENPGNNSNNNIPGSNPETLDQITVPDGFDYTMTKIINIDLRFTLKNGDSPSNTKVKIYTNKPSNGGDLIKSVLTDSSGVYRTKIEIGIHLEKLFVVYDYVGSVDGEWLIIDGDTAYYERNDLAFRGLNFLNKILRNTSQKVYAYYTHLGSDYEYLGSFDDEGVPDYLQSVDDVLTLSFLDDVNASLPEKKPVPDYHPDYIADGVNANTILTEEAEVWITFVHEGAGYKNVLGYYTYDKNDPPKKKSDLKNLKIIFPNTSYKNSGGGLESGNKVYLGIFPKDTVIGYFIIADGWDKYNKTNTDGQQIFYSNSDFNPEKKAADKRHNVMLWDSERDILLLGFEDLNRARGSDDDFNDAVFFLTVNPPKAVDKTNLQEIDKPKDTDSDGVNDIYDEYPNDPLRAFNNYYPSQNSTGTLAFEDLWPSKGDYDFNDLVIAYNYQYVTNASTEIVEIFADFTIKAVGAGFRNGFGFEIPVPYTTVSSVTGNSIKQNYIKLNTNGTEQNNENTVIIVSDNINRMITKPNGHFINTEKNAPYVDPVSFNVTISFSTPVKLTDAGPPPFNPFIIVNQDRSKEVHLPGKNNTDLADTQLFGQFDDKTVLNEKYYITENNLPWALNIPYEFKHLRERVSIDRGYLKFTEWAKSGGSVYSDWYLDGTGKRDHKNIYEIP
ncbi:MAG: LruC domain-containing protein [Desulfobacterales bacterium]|nr:LruC domain-containing protein [Desulfobacterales bacterium]MCP4160854.1 LruC domain-containing protein [Deltaproteobacteria bacterium]